MNPVLQQLQAEAQRRGMGQLASNAGTQPNPSASQPAVQQPATQPNMMKPQQPTMPTSADPFGGASQMMNGSAPVQGGTTLEKALVKRMMMYPPA